MHGVAFDALPAPTRDAIELYCTQHSMPVWRMRYRQSIDIVTRATEIMRNLRGHRRRLVGLPASVRVDSAIPGELPTTRTFVLEEIGQGGARLIGEAPIAPGTGLSFTVPGSTISGNGVVRHVQTLHTPVALLFSMGVEFNRLPGGRTRTLPWSKPLAMLGGSTNGNGGRESAQIS
jgi:hypothetical protein